LPSPSSRLADAWRVNRYVRGASDDFDAVEALPIPALPDMMWRNTEVPSRRRVATAPTTTRLPRRPKKALRLRSLQPPRLDEGLLQYLERVDPDAAKRAARAMPASTNSARRASLWLHRR